MLQRIQSVFFLLAILVNLAVLFTPVWQFGEAQEMAVLSGLDEEAPNADDLSHLFFEHEDAVKSVTHAAFFGLTILSGLYLLWLIFQFNDRSRQIKLAYVGALMILIEILALVLTTQRQSDFVSASASSQPAYGMIFPVLAVFLVFLGIRGIRNDEEKVRSVDRIR